MGFLSFIVGVRNREEKRIMAFLNSLAKQDDPDFELIFVDYGSEPEDAQKLKQLLSSFSFARYRYFDTRGQHWNRSKCLNEGIQLATGEFIFTADIDFLFAPSFVRQCTLLKQKNKEALYFRVAFLTRQQSKNTETDLTKYAVKEFSDKNAIGPLLISAKQIRELGGYDEFYEIWGLEDNDLLHRINLTGENISFYTDQTLIWHNWHLPAKKSGNLPSGWLKYLSDYFNYKKSLGKKAPVYLCNTDRQRPILQQHSPARTILISSGAEFLPVHLKSELAQMHAKETLKIKFDFTAYQGVQNARLNRFTKKVNAWLGQQANLELQNKNMRAYVAPGTARDAMLYFIKAHPELVRDYYFPREEESGEYLIMKR
jgi:glycosyltransferase involved in cell wall biosynthesis